MADRKTPPFPIFLDLAGATVLVVGCNDIAARRAEAVLRSGAHVRLACATLAQPVAHLGDDERVTWLGREFQPDDINGCRLVMVATEDDAFNHVVSGLAHGAGVLVNVADSLRLCSFIMPAIVDRAPITIAMSSGGAAPVLARRSPSISAYTFGLCGRNGAPKQVLNVVCGSVTPTSVPASLAV